MYRIATAATLAIVSMGAACGTTAPASVSGLRRAVGTDLIGARGATPQDQRKIDLTVVGICAVDGIWTRAECARHGNGK
ncbi:MULTISPECIES: hypothetical protein [Rhizobium/Agrobacterium group]|uniref:hypothetical protein n=1 Tax=Rhizobium/Agrobacterium group TaxID=227290 RepID=UPI002301A619|nr:MULTISPECIES: hypothetical protein [Rhizobium/Agrobacterium group]MDA5633405.1 hypothetical protein [Agrobacterium sp. ST15.16.024]MDF1889049.1 hypothetical protein [Rhizobium rhizogenes]